MSLEFPIALPPAAGETLAIMPGLHWVRMPLPFALDHINLWLMEEEQGWALVDTGVPDQRTRALWEGLFIGLMGGRPLSRLAVTHFHPDHMGLASWFEERFGVTLETTLAEWLHGRLLSVTSDDIFGPVASRFYRAAGLSGEALAMMERAGNTYGKRVPAVPSGFRRIRHGDDLVLGGRHWKVLVGEGHAPEMACLWCEEANVLISGDQILPSISPNVGIWPNQPDADHLKEFLASLARFRALPADTLVLPSHGLPFRGLHERIDRIISHHHDRLAQAFDACREPMTAVEVMPILFTRQLDRHQFMFALGETLAHLHCLWGEGRLVRETDGQGVNRFRQAGRG